MSIRVALIDSGFDAGTRSVAARQFVFHEDTLSVNSAMPDVQGHGSALAKTVVTLAPDCALLNAQVFIEKMVTTPIAIAAALDWSVEQGARLVNMSFGLADDREVLKKACEQAVAQGVYLFAAAPARGGPVYPSAYPGVFRVSGDARLKFGEVSVLEAGGQADFGGCVTPGGASFAVAQIVGLSARWLGENPAGSRTALCTHLHDIAKFKQPERKEGAAV